MTKRKNKNKNRFSPKEFKKHSAKGCASGRKKDNSRCEKEWKEKKW